MSNNHSETIKKINSLYDSIELIMIRVNSLKATLPKNKLLIFKDTDIYLSERVSNLFIDTIPLKVNLLYNGTYISYLDNVANNVPKNDCVLVHEILELGDQIKDHLLPKLLDEYYDILHDYLIKAYPHCNTVLKKCDHRKDFEIRNFLSGTTNCSDKDIDKINTLYQLIPECPEIQEIVTKKIRQVLHPMLVELLIDRN